MPLAERMFRAMGSDCHVMVVTTSKAASNQLGDLAMTQVGLPEDCWSRFRPASELSRLNLRAGSGAVRASDDLFALVHHMKTAWAATDGRFDPTVLTSMIRLGCGADFDAIRDMPMAAVVAVHPAPGMSKVRLERTAKIIDMPAVLGVDPGAIGKGLAADIICAELTTAGASGVLVNLGGDLAFSGNSDGAQEWHIAIEDGRRPDQDPRRTLRVLTFERPLERVGIATSTTLTRRWAQGRRHHVIDPRTGSMAASDLVQVTVVAPQAWLAEVATTTVLLMPSTEAVAWLRTSRTTSVLLTEDRDIHVSNGELCSV